MDPADEEIISKSERKRRHHAIRDLGAALADLAPKQLARIPLDDELMAVVMDAAKAQRSARQRQLRYLAKRLAAADLGPIQAAYEAVKGEGDKATAKQHRLEHWRERLIEEGDKALDEYLQAYPEAPRGELRALVRQSRSERERQRPPKSARQLFRLLRGLDDERDVEAAEEAAWSDSDEPQ